MKRFKAFHPARFSVVLFCSFLFTFALSSCGGGGGGGGGGHGGAGYKGQTLTSITFPEYTDLSGATKTPPANVPLSQQVLFTFSDPVAGDVHSGNILINANPGLDYQGPDVALDGTKNLIVARGTYEIMDNVVVFTPYIPTGEIDLSINAVAQNVPGLLPGYTYTVFVPTGTSGSIEDLVAIDPGVDFPIEFTTWPEEMPAFFFKNQPVLPPGVVTTDPVDGTVDFPINSVSGELQGFPAPRDIEIQFDQPLDFDSDNIQGSDLDGDTVSEENIFLAYDDSVMYTAVDETFSELGYLAMMEAGSDEFEFLGYTFFNMTKVGVKSIVATKQHMMLVCSETALYDADFENISGTPPFTICELSNERLFSPLGVKASSICIRLDTELQRKLYGLNDLGTSLLEIDVDTGAVVVLGTLVAGLGDFVDLTMGRDGALYGLRVYDPGTPNAISSIEKINSNLTCETVVSGLSGDYCSLDFFHIDTMVLYEANAMEVVHLDLQTGSVKETHAIDDAQLTSDRRVDFALRHYELGGTVTLLNNSYHGATVKLEPSGILPIGKRIEMMVRFSLKNLSGGSMHENYGFDPYGAEFVGSFETYDPGPGDAVIEDFFMEEFLDNEMEQTKHELANARAIWNVQDLDGQPPEYKHLLAGLGLSGSGELGDFRPVVGVASIVMLDTDYQPLPLNNGATPDITKPVIIKTGEFHFREINIPYGVTVMAMGSKPLVFTATGEVTIGGTIDVSGQNGTNDTTFNSAFMPTPGGPPGPGGGRGGMGQPPIPPNFKNLTDLQSVPTGERGYGPGNIKQTGGFGGESGAKDKFVPWQGSKNDPDSRGAGGGGGSFYQEGHIGYPGKGQYGVDEDGEFYIRDVWEWWDGSYEYDPTWHEGDPLDEQTKINEFGNTGDEHIDHAPHPGDIGNLVFKDGDEDNDFIGEYGEVKELIGGQGGGGGGSRLDSMRPVTKGQGAAQNPPKAASCYDSKGGGGGGGSGSIAIHSLEGISIESTGCIYAMGGRGGGGEVIGHSSFGGGAGGGSGGAIILNSAKTITIEENGCLNVAGGWGDDAKETTGVGYVGILEPCKIQPGNGLLNYSAFCSWSRGDGGYGGYGLIQLMVPDPENDLVMVGWPDGEPKEWTSVECDICKIQWEPDKMKHYNAGQQVYYSRFEVRVKGTPKNYYGEFPRTTECLVDPYKTKSTISSHTYAVSKWIDMGRIIDRNPINDEIPPYFWFENPEPGTFPDLLDGFRGVRETTIGGQSWAEAYTIGHYVLNGATPPDDEDSNDFKVEAPDSKVAQIDYIPEDNHVAFQFQGTDALIPGSKVANEDPAVVNEDTWTHDLTELSGKQFIRFRIRLDSAWIGTLSPESKKPQIDYVRMRFKY